MINYDKMAARLFEKVDARTIAKVNELYNLPDGSGKYKALKIMFNIGVELGYDEKTEELKCQKLHKQTADKMRKKLKGTSSLQK